MKTLKLSIAKPCNEDWQQMTQLDQGKHCSSCQRVVIDFSKMSDSEIVQYLLKHKSEKICGNFYSTQINRPMGFVNKKKSVRWPSIAAMLVAGMFQLMPSNSFAQQRTPQHLYPKPMSFAKEEARDKDIKTEPSKDSLVTYNLKIYSSDTKLAIYGAVVRIEKLGTFTSNGQGLVTITIEENKIPDMLEIEIFAHGYEMEFIHISRQKISANKIIEAFLLPGEIFMMKGDVSFEDMH